MGSIQKTLGALVMMGAATLWACSCDTPNRGAGEHGGESRGEHSGESRGEHGGESRGEHDREGNEHGGEGEESGIELALDARYDQVRHGARLILAYDAASKSFVGTVQNTTNATLKRVRVEVHLSNGKELGPTKPVDLAPGKKMDITLKPDSGGFERWTAHPEVGSGEHGSEGEGREHK